MEMIIAFLAGLALAGLVALMMVRHANKKADARVEKEAAAAEELAVSRLKAQYAAELTRAESERDNALAQLETSRQDQKVAQSQWEYTLQQRLKEQHLRDVEECEKRIVEKESSDKKLLESRENAYREALKRMEEHHAESMKSQQERFDETIKNLSVEMKSSTEEILKRRQEDLDKANTVNMKQLLDPLKLEMDAVKDLMKDTRSTNEKSSESLKGALEAMINQTQQLGKDANNLADALKNKGKVHGDWGEQVLEDLLMGSGLRENEEFSRQESYKDNKNNELRPDVVVKCADGKRIIIDSKVSLKAYADALGAETEEERKEAIKKNYESVKKHVKELADKQYPKWVEGALDYVLMFVPNEGSYVMAMNYDHSLGQEAYRQGVIIVNPTNLMLTLHLVLQTWQNSRQEDNCRNIIAAANGMYDKVMGLVDTCRQLGTQLATATKTYDKAIGQLSDGNGNLLRRVEGLKEMGVTSTKQLKVRKVQNQELPEKTSDADEAGE